MSSGEWRGYDGVYDDKGATAEARLWMAVVEKTINDFRHLIRQARKDIMRRGQPSSFVLWDLKTLRYELKTEWFEEIAEYAGLHQSTIIALIDREALKVGIDLKKPVLNPHKVRGITVLN